MLNLPVGTGARLEGRCTTVDLKSILPEMPDGASNAYAVRDLSCDTLLGTMACEPDWCVDRSAVTSLYVVVSVVVGCSCDGLDYVGLEVYLHDVSASYVRESHCTECDGSLVCTLGSFDVPALVDGTVNSTADVALDSLDVVLVVWVVGRLSSCARTCGEMDLSLHCPSSACFQTGCTLGLYGDALRGFPPTFGGLDWTPLFAGLLVCPLGRVRLRCCIGC